MSEKNYLNNRLSWLLFGVVTIEIVAQTYGFLWGNKILFSIIYLLSGLGIAIIPVLKWTVAPCRESPVFDRMAVFLLLILIIWCIRATPDLFSNAPLDHRHADMLPVIEIMARRWWQNLEIYAPIEEIWGGMRPIYLPAMWLPYSMAILVNADIRWISVSLLLISLVLIFFSAPGKQSLHTGRLLGMVPVILLFLYLFGFYSTLITLSEEPVVVFYYVLLGWALIRRKPVLTGMAMALCLLSRYALAFWIPIYLIFQFVFQSKRAGYLTFSALIICSTILLSLGKAWGELSFFLQLQDSYLQNLLNEASRWKFVAQIENNPGLIKFLPYDKIDLWHRLLITGSVLVPFFGLTFFKFWHKQLDTRFFGLCSLKLSLVYFYNMLTIPYSYLFYPSAFLSLLILYVALSVKKEPMPDGIFS